LIAAAEAILPAVAGIVTMATIRTLIILGQYPIDTNLEAQSGKVLQKKHLAEVANIADVLRLDLISRLPRNSL